jgi:hypothetical protein
MMISLAISCAASGDPGDAAGALGDPKVQAKLRDLGLEIAEKAGVSSPMRMYVVAVADHQEAETVLSGDTIYDHSPVYVIVMIGGPFTSTHPAPPGQPSPQGNVLTVTVNAATYDVTDLGFVNIEPDLSKVASDTVTL